MTRTPEKDGIVTSVNNGKYVRKISRHTTHTTLHIHKRGMFGTIGVACES